ncbi:MAG TPA: ABC transporter ATP-binding protein [bacterium]|nr:ABC transporter ATP-binding protein [bacterium]
MIRLSGLSFGYDSNGGFRLNDVSLEIREGESVMLLGANGAGKTTLLKVMAGIFRAYSGSARAGDKEIKDYARADFARLVSYIPQQENHIFEFSVFEIAVMGRRPYINGAGMLKKRDVDAVKAALDRFGMLEKAGRKFLSLSGGEKRIVMIARAIAQEAKVLLMDEPATYLDISHKASLMETACALSREGKIVIMITHDINTAAGYIDRAVFMKNGAIAYDGPAKEIITPAALSEIYGVKNAVVGVNPLTGGPNIFIRPS